MVRPVVTLAEVAMQLIFSFFSRLVEAEIAVNVDPALGRLLLFVKEELFWDFHCVFAKLQIVVIADVVHDRGFRGSAVALSDSVTLRVKLQED